MDNGRGPNVLSVTPENSVSTPAAHVRVELSSLAVPIGCRRKPGDLISPTRTRTLKPSGRSANACTDEDEIDAMSPTPSLIHSILGNFASAMFSISLIISIVFFAVTWLTILRSARSIKDQILPNATGVSLSLCLNECALLTVVVAVDINTWLRPPTRPRCTRVIHFMDGRCLRCTHHLRGSILVLFLHPRGLRTVQ